MFPRIKAIPLICICNLFAFGQSKQETIDFIISEFKSIENNTYVFKDVTFSQGGAIFTFRRYRPGKPDKAVVIDLKDVDIYRVAIHHANGADFYNLDVRSLGRDGNFMANGLKYNGTWTLLGRIDSERKARALEKAFLRLTELTTGRKDLFPVP